MFNFRQLLILLSTYLLSISSPCFAQDPFKDATIQGNLYTDIKCYIKDTPIDAEDAPEKVRTNAYGNILFRYRGFSAGIRYEAYQPPIMGYDSQYEGQGIAYRFMSYTDSLYSITLGNYYEQFGSGLILRSYEDKNLGIDNSIDGFRLFIRPTVGVSIKGIIGRQRNYWDWSPGIVRGVDAELNLFDAFRKPANSTLLMGVSFVSRYQEDNDPIYKLPENVAAFAGRLSYYQGTFQVSGEYAYKVNDPSTANNIIYKEGQALVLSSSISGKGLGFLLSAKWIDNLDFRSARGATGNALTMSYVPASFLQHTYNLPAMYPYASQPLGEASINGEISYRIPKETILGGKYGTNIMISMAMANSIKKGVINDTTAIGESGTLGYKTAFLSIGDQKYFRDFTVEISRKFSRKLKSVLGFTDLFYNKSFIEGHPGEDDVYAWVIYGDISYRISESNNLRMELQHLQTKQDRGSWAMMLIEYTIAPKWFVSVTDQYNYGNDSKDRRIHYLNLSLGYTKQSHRLNISWGRQREGVICTGGVCRKVPSSNGFGLTYSTTF